jgi:hypothetical protein
MHDGDNHELLARLAIDDPVGKGLDNAPSNTGMDHRIK